MFFVKNALEQIDFNLYCASFDVAHVVKMLLSVFDVIDFLLSNNPAFLWRFLIELMFLVLMIPYLCCLWFINIESIKSKPQKQCSLICSYIMKVLNGIIHFIYHESLIFTDASMINKMKISRKHFKYLIIKNDWFSRFSIYNFQITNKYSPQMGHY